MSSLDNARPQASGETKMYSVVDASGEYLKTNGSRTPASNEAATWETEAEAAKHIDRATDRVVEND